MLSGTATLKLILMSISVLIIALVERNFVNFSVMFLRDRLQCRCVFL